MATHGTLNMYRNYDCRCDLCKVYYRKYYREAQRRKYKKRKQLAYDIVGHECTNCGSADGIQFDHVDPATKNFTIGDKLNNAPWGLLEEELKKCQPLCDPCHKEKNKIDNGEAQHGTRTMYTYHKCRCKVCKDAHNAYCREYKKERRRRKREQLEVKN